MKGNQKHLSAREKGVRIRLGMGKLGSIVQRVTKLGSLGHGGVQLCHCLCQLGDVLSQLGNGGFQLINPARSIFLPASKSETPQEDLLAVALQSTFSESMRGSCDAQHSLLCGLAMALQRASSFPPAKSETPQEDLAVALNVHLSRRVSNESRLQQCCPLCGYGNSLRVCSLEESSVSHQPLCSALCK